MEDYTKINEGTTEFTGTWRMPTQAECADEIVRAMTIYAKKRWYQKKKYLLKRAVSFATTYNHIEESIRLSNNK